MSRYWTFFVILVLVGGVIAWFWYGGESSLMKGRVLSFNKIFPDDLVGLVEKADNLIKNIKTKSDASTKQFFSDIVEKPKDLASNIVSDVKTSVAENVKNQIAQALGIGATGQGQNFSKNIAIVRPISQGIALFIESDNEGIKYTIKWGDGESSFGQLEPKQQKTLDHIWQSSGDYSISVDIENIKDKQQRNFIFPVKIVK